MVKVEVPIRHMLISQENFYWTQFTRNNFGALPFSMTYGYPAKLIIYYVFVLLTSYGMEQDLHINTSKYGVWDSTSSMYLLQEIIFMIDQMVVIS